MAQGGTWRWGRSVVVPVWALLSVSCSSTTNDDSRTDATEASGGKDGSGGKSAGGALTMTGGDTGKGGASTGGGGTGAGGETYDCIAPGYYCAGGTVSVVTQFGVQGNGSSCAKFVYRCTNGCRVDQVIEPTHTFAVTPAAAQTLCNEWDSGVVDAGMRVRSDAGACEGGLEAGC
jgi:hypothetical protein